ncbi:hypothetical protein GCK72_026206 [Caenorhabditis remanei]|uniref:F-box domain-containing protein n=1 Tax=Caenorhabditis remanei TaxID=31234 RepID=A0A6A5G461_CAERE|nr:hypothetical protein GCK72_026206 [Caenorhabditis remanei]KAF1749737.1 hypothetical protein GCK72_026206 [Caenorhabditis remanei]
MSIQFLKFPWLAQLEVLKQLELHEIFLLSLCSEKMKKVVQCLNMKPTNLVYLFLDNGVGVVARYDNTHNQIDHNFANVEFVPAIPSDEIKPMKCMKETFEGEFFHSLHYFAPEEITVLESLQRHMRDLFRFDVRVQLELYSLHYLNMSRIIKDVTDTSFDVEKLDTEQLENYLTIHPGQDSLHLTAKLTGPQLRSDSKLCSIKGIIYFKLDSEVMDCSEWMDIQQDGGGKWASITWSQKHICFIVWD